MFKAAFSKQETIKLEYCAEEIKKPERCLIKYFWCRKLVSYNVKHIHYVNVVFTFLNLDLHSGPAVS